MEENEWLADQRLSTEFAIRPHFFSRLHHRYIELFASKSDFFFKFVLMHEYSCCILYALTFFSS